MRIYKSGETQPDGPFRVSGTYCGEAFTGKTHNACSWPDWLLLAFDPDTGTARSTPGGVVLELESFLEFEQDVMPYVRARELDKLVKKKLGEDRIVQTLIFDTVSMAGSRCFNEILGGRAQATRKDFGLLLNSMTDMAVKCIDTTRQYQEGQTTYHVIFNTHLSFVGGGEEGASRVVGWRPAIPGQFKDILPRLGGFCFICKQEVTQTLEGGKAVPRRGFHILTSPPSDLYLAGDRIGGDDKLYKGLAPKMGGTYRDLMTAWGLNPEEEAAKGRNPQGRNLQ